METHARLAQEDKATPKYDWQQATDEVVVRLTK